MKKILASSTALLLSAIPGTAFAQIPSEIWIYCGNLPGCPGSFREYATSALILAATLLPPYVYAIGVLFIMVGGGYMVLAAGREDWISKGKNTIIYAVVGIALTRFASAIIGFLVAEVNTRVAAPDLVMSVTFTAMTTIFDLLYVAILAVGIYCGMWMVLSFGKEDQFGKARDGLFWCAVGGIVVNIADLIASAFATL